MLAKQNLQLVTKRLPPGRTQLAGACLLVVLGSGLGSLAVKLVARIHGAQADSDQIAFRATDIRIDVVIDGDGFLQARRLSGEMVYARDGLFSVDDCGWLVVGSNGNGPYVEPNIVIPEDALDVVISPDGSVAVSQVGQEEMTQIGQLQIARFANPAGLLRLSESVYAQTAASGQPMLGSPGSQGLGVLRGGLIQARLIEWRRDLMGWVTTELTPLANLRRLRWAVNS
jgi:flagellar basal-body rod protein FlgG